MLLSCRDLCLLLMSVRPLRHMSIARMWNIELFKHVAIITQRWIDLEASNPLIPKEHFFLSLLGKSSFQSVSPCHVWQTRIVGEVSFLMWRQKYEIVWLETPLHTLLFLPLPSSRPIDPWLERARITFRWLWMVIFWTNDGTHKVWHTSSAQAEHLDLVPAWLDKLEGFSGS